MSTLTPILPALPHFAELPEETGDLLLRFCETGAPTGRELRRATFIQEWLHEIKAGCAELDEDHNLVVDLSGGTGSVWLLDAHIDTVSTDLQPAVTRRDGRWHCEGIHDNGAACVLLMLLARQFLRAGRHVPLLISFSTGEEGRGDLRGIRGVMKRRGERLRGGFAFDTHLHNVTVAAVGSARYRAVWSGPGGHSWGDFEESASANHALCEWVAALRELLPWKAGFLSYNIGRLSGGAAINVIAEEAEAELDLRSVDPAALQQAWEASQAEALKIARRSRVSVKLFPLGNRPAAAIPAHWEGLEFLREVHQELNLPVNPQTDSTNANAILEAGIPATCTGLSIGGNIHTREEWLDFGSLNPGWKKLQRLSHYLTHSDQND